MRRERKRLLAIGLCALGVGVAVTAVIALRKPADVAVPPLEPPKSAAASSEVTVKLRTNVAGARFVVDGKPLAGDTLRGNRGDKKRVLIEADGYTPLELRIELETDTELPEMVLSPRPAESAGAIAAQVVEVTPKGSVKVGGPRPSGSPSVKTSAQPTQAPTVSVAPTASVTAAPAATPTLTIKRY